jgi:hypothetical protein
MKAEFKFYNVGQGCFYGGKIEHKGQQFVLVYDCGSVSAKKYLDDSIIEFRKEFKQIDLLIVSHLDKDHVNGIKDLITGIIVKNIILPYLPLIDRLALASSYTTTDVDYTSFLNNPISYLQSDEFNVKDFYYMNPETDSDNEDDDSNEPPKFNQDDIGEFNLSGFKEDEAFKLSVIADDERLKEDSSLIFLSLNTTLFLSKNFWEFVFYHRKVTVNTAIKDFQKDVENYMQLNSITKLHDLFDSHINNIRTLYTSNLKFSINRTSICLYHGPLFKAYTRGNINTKSMWYGKWWYLNKKRFNKFGTLLTGDQELKTKKDFNSFISHYQNKLKHIEIFQVPHHGSNANWNLMPNALSNQDIGCYVINHGFGSKHHPHINVLENIKKNSRRVIVLNNELAHFNYLIKNY